MKKWEYMWMQCPIILNFSKAYMNNLIYSKKIKNSKLDKLQIE